MQKWLQLPCGRAAVTTRQSCPPSHTDMAAREVCRSRVYPPHAGPQRATHHTHKALAVRATQTRLQERCAARACIHQMRVRNVRSHSASARCARDTDRLRAHTQRAIAMRAHQHSIPGPLAHMRRVTGVHPASAGRRTSHGAICRSRALHCRTMNCLRTHNIHINENPHAHPDNRTPSNSPHATHDTGTNTHGRSTRPPRAWNKRNTICPPPA
jgi:hypothetical protein